MCVVFLQAPLDLLLRALAGVAIAFLEFPDQLVLMPADLLEIMIGEPASPRAEFRS
jgi:hypothetical protein